LKRRTRLLIAVVAVVLVSASAVIAGYIYTSRPVQSQLEIIAEDHAIPSFPETGLMILCPSKARDMGLCAPDERDLHARYRLVVQPPPPPEVSLQVECKVFEKAKYAPFDNSIFPVWHSGVWANLKTRLMDATSNFTCSYTRTGEGTFGLDLAFIGDPDDAPLIASYVLVVTIGYDEPSLPFGLLSRTVNGTSAGDLCLLGYHFGKHPPSGTSQSEKPLGEFLSCEEAALMQRDLFGIPIEPPSQLSGYSDTRLESKWSKASVTIDGAMNPSEWSDADKLPLDGVFLAASVDVDLYAKNDNDFLYVAVDATPSQRPTASSRFEVRAFFDVDHDSAWVGGRDVVYVYSSNPSYSGFIRYSEKCDPNFLYLDGQYSELAPCLTPLNELGAMQGRYYGQPAGHWVVEMKIPLRGEGGILTQPGQVVGMEIGIWGGADSYREPGFYGRLPAELIDLTLASGVGAGDGANTIRQSQSIQATIHFQRGQTS